VPAVLAAVLVAVALAARPDLVAAEVLVRLAAAATVEAEDVVLGDVATVQGEEPLAARARALRLGPAPALGAAFRLDADGLRRRLRTAHLDPARFRIEGAQRAVVTRAAQVIAGPALIETVRRQVLERHAQAGQRLDDNVTVSAVIPPDDLRVPTGRLELRARVQEAASGSSFVSATVIVLVDGREVQAVPLTLKLGRLRPVVVATTALAPRAALSPAAVRVEQRSSTEVPADALTDPSGIADLEVIAPAAPGDVLTARTVRPRLLVRRGDLVTLVVEGRGFVITSQGRASDDARRGESVRVVNPASRRDVLGVAEAPGVVRVPFHESRSH
jgi:flagella basal body P-ring formation protein FlgA